MFKKQIKITHNSSWDEIRNAQELIGLQNEIKSHIRLCQEYNFTKEQAHRQLIFMYGKDYKKLVDTEIVA